MSEKKKDVEAVKAAPAVEKVIGTIDHLATAVHARAASQLIDVDDFDEGYEIDGQLPAWLPKEKDGHKLHYYRIGIDSFRTHHMTQPGLVGPGAGPLAIPLTRVTFPEIEGIHFNEQGFIQLGDTVLCVSRQDTYEKYKAIQKRRAVAQLAQLERSVDEQSGRAPGGHKPVTGRVVSGLGIEGVGGK